MSLNINILRRITPRWVVFTIDMTISFLSLILAYYLRFNFKMPSNEVESLPFVILFVLGVRALSYLLAKTYAGMVRFTGSQDIVRILVALFFGSVIFVLFNFVNLYINDRYFIPISVIIIDFFITGFVLAFSRLDRKSVV